MTEKKNEDIDDATAVLSNQIIDDTTALIDEATGFQAVRPKDDLRKYAESQNKTHGITK